MTKLRTLLMDDEHLALDLLEATLQGHPVIELVGRCASGADALRHLEANGADLMFLDIETPGMSGLEVARVARAADPAPMIIFATAHAEFAVEAFEADAVDYVLKPFERERVLCAVEKASVQAPYRLAGAGRAVVPVAPRETLPVKDGGRTNLVRISDITWAEGAGDYALLHTGEVTHTARVTLRDLARELERAGFLRVHRSAIVRASKVASVEALPKGEAVLILDDGTAVKASRTYREAIEALLA